MKKRIRGDIDNGVTEEVVTGDVVTDEVVTEEVVTEDVVTGDIVTEDGVTGDRCSYNFDCITCMTDTKKTIETNTMGYCKYRRPFGTKLKKHVCGDIEDCVNEM